jgi:hypothetical protein
VLGKDAAGNWWIYCDLPVIAWPGVQKELKALQG